MKNDAGFGGLGLAGKFSRLFLGTTLKDTGREEEQKIINKQTIVAIENDDAADLIDISQFYTSGGFDRQNLQSQVAVINEYRGMAVHHEVDRAIDDIINEAVTSDADESPVDLVFKESIDLPEKIKESISDEWDYLIHLLKFDLRSYEIFRQFYVDGRLYYHKIIDPNQTKKGILKLINLDPRATKKVREVLSETDKDSQIERITDTRTYYLYDPTYMNAVGTGDSASARTSVNRLANQALELSEDTISFIHTGMLSGDSNNVVVGYLEKARKPLNNLRMLEDAVVIYRITRAPERRIFYVDVGSLPKKGAEEYMSSLITKYKTKLVYDGNTGTVKGNSHQVSMMEDYWLPRREGGKGTEIDTLKGGENLGQIEDLRYFQKNLLKSLNVPQSRLESEATISIGNRATEINRDELKFNKFVQRLRRRFNGLFLDLLRTQLILKGITNAEDWDNIILPHLTFEYASDAYVKEEQDAMVLENRLQMLAMADPFVGKYMTREDVLKQIMRKNDEQIKAMDKTIDKEIKDGFYPSPQEVHELENNIHPKQLQQQEI
jgi:hypothetical protein